MSHERVDGSRELRYDRALRLHSRVVVGQRRELLNLSRPVGRFSSVHACLLFAAPCSDGPDNCPLSDQGISRLQFVRDSLDFACQLRIPPLLPLPLPLEKNSLEMPKSAKVSPEDDRGNVVDPRF